MVRDGPPERKRTVLTFGLNVSLIGMGVVFVALVMLVYIIKGISRFAAAFEKSSAPLNVKASRTPPAADRGADRDEEELAAVIAAAVAAYSSKR
jgi:glutaconyl-CoA/methylmalonyl-CoA decarboxylase subunit delta